jgi:hypothetical protein
VVGVKTVQRAASERLAGGRPSRVRASVSAAMAGAFFAATVYKALRG